MKRGRTARPASLNRVGAFLFTFALAPILLSGAAISQETTLRSQSNIVLVPALVKDPHGEIVYGLEAKDFIIEDDGVEQTIRLDEAPEGQPISLVVALQRGRRADYEFARMKGLQAMLDPIFALGTAKVALVEFDSRVNLARPFTKDESLIDADLSGLQPGDNGAAILDAISDSITLLKQEPDERQRVLLLISEQRDHGSKAKIDATVAAIGKSNTVMYALAFSPALSNILDTERGNNNPDLHPEQTEMNPGPDLLAPLVMAVQAMRKNVPKTVAEMTGGEYELFATRKKFDIRMNDFTNHLHNRYLLSFAPKNPHPGLHQLRVRLRDSNKKNTTLLARSSYWAESSTPDR
jgi:VWFA-related protein